MNAPASALASVIAAIAARTDPAKFHKDTPPGTVGVLVTFGPVPTKPTPASIRAAFENALDRAGAPSALIVAADGSTGLNASGLFLKSLPDPAKGTSPVASLGLATNKARNGKDRWILNRTFQNSSRWTYCAAHVTADSADIHGAGTYAEASADGTLTIESGIPADIATRLRAAYDAARGVVEPSRVQSLVAAYVKSVGGRYITPTLYMLPEVNATTCGVLAGLTDLGGFADTFVASDPATYAAPIARGVSEQIDEVTESVRAFVEKTIAVTAPGSDAKIQPRSLETVRADIEAARSAAETWRSRLKLASLDVSDALDALTAEAVKAGNAALDAMKARVTTY